MAETGVNPLVFDNTDSPLFTPEDGIGLPNSEEIQVNIPGERSPYSPEMLDTMSLLTSLAQSDTDVIDPVESITQFQENVDQVRALIESGQESALRLQISNQERNVESDRIRTALILDASQGKEDLLKLETLYDEFERIQKAEVDPNKLESTALDRLEDYALSHPEQGDMLELMAKDIEAGGSLFGTLRDQLERTIIMRRDVDKAAKAVKEQSLGADILDIVARIIPLNKLTTVDNIVESSLLDLTGTKILLANQNLLSISREEFNKKWPQVVEAVRNESGYISENRQLVLEVFHQLGNINENKANVENLFDFIDFATLAPLLKTVPVLTKASIAKLSHHRALAQTVTENTIQAEKNAVISVVSGSPDDINVGVVTLLGRATESVAESAIDDAMPTAMKATEQLIDNGVGLSGAVNIGLSATAKAIDVVRRALNLTPRLTAEELDEAFQAARVAAIDSYGESAVIDFKVIPVEVSPGTFVDKYTMIIGRKDGVGYHSRGMAMREAKRKGLLVTSDDIIQDADGLHYINIESNIDEAGYVHVLLEDGRTSGFFANTYIKSPTSFLPDILQSRAATSVFAKGRLQKILRPMVNNLKGLSRKQRQSVGAVLKKGNIEQKWYNLTEFTRHYSELHQGRLPTNREVLSYYTIKDINDFDFILRNHAEYISRATQGWQTGRVSAANGVTVRLGNMKEITRVDDASRALILDVSENTVLEGRKVGIDNLVKRMKDEGLRLYRVEGDDLAHNGLDFNHVLVKKGDVTLKDLEYRQLDYAAGGHRIYDGLYFGKQAVTATTASGSQIIKNAQTHIVAPTKKIAQEWAERMNAARDAYKKALSDPEYTLQADRIIRESGIEDGLEGWAKLIDDGKIQDERFSVTFDREPLEIKRADNSYDISTERGGRHEYLQNQGRLYYSPKGPVLKGPQEETAELIDPFAAATRAVENSAATAAYVNYRVNGIQRWMATYGNLLPSGDGLSPLQRFWSTTDVRTLGKGDANTMNRAESIRRSMQRQLGVQTEFGQAVKNALRNLAEFSEVRAAGGIGSKVSKRVLNLMDKDPVGAIKGFSFDLKLGLFDPSQLLIQTHTIFALASLNPTKFPKFMFDGALMRYAAVNTSDEMLSWAAKRSSMEAGEFKAMVKSMRESGITDINGELVLLDHTATAYLGPTGSTISKIRDMGRIPFFEAERLNRIYAWRKAWDDMRSGIKTGSNKVPAKSIKEMLTPDGIAELARLTDKFTMNMTSASAAFWQKGLLSIPTQFLSYQARLLENILPVIGNRQWSNSEKARLFIGQVLLYGSVGVPGGRYVLDSIFRHTGVEFDPESLADQTAYRAMVGGFWDSMLYAVTNGELDIAVSKRAAVGEAVLDFWNRISGGGFETQSVLEFAGGSPFGTIGDVSSDAWDVIKAMIRASQSETVSLVEITPGLLNDLAVNASSWSRATRAYYVWKYGEWISQETGKTLARATSIEGLAAAFGFPLRELGDMSFARTMMQNRATFIKDQSKTIAKLQLEAARLWNNDDKEGWESKLRQISMIVQVLDPKDKEEIIKAARGTSDWRTTTEIMKDDFMKKFKPLGSPELPTDNSRIR
jgi:hypothetical protein